MSKRAGLAVVAVFIAWSVLDFVLHGIFLQPVYQATAHLWRPMEEMKMSLMYVVTLLYAAGFVAIYGFLVTEKSLASGLKFGFLFGLTAGIGMGFGTYCYQAIPLSLAWSWLFGTLAESIAAGAVVGAILKSAAPQAG